jgi:hypothetical protein
MRSASRPTVDDANTASLARQPVATGTPALHRHACPTMKAVQAISMIAQNA